MQTQYSYEATLAASEKIDWRIEDIIGGDKNDCSASRSRRWCPIASRTLW